MAPRLPRPWPAPRLGQVAQVAAAAGASPGAVEALRQDAAARRVERQSAGGRLDAARARASRTQRQAADARAALAAVEQRAQEAEQTARVAQEELAEIEASLATPAPAPATVESAGLLGHVRELLAALETAPMPGIIGTGPALPETALAAMSALRRHVEGPTEAGRLDEALGEQAAPAGDRIKDEGAPTEVERAQVGVAEDSIMDELDSADDRDDEAMLAIARRLKRTRRG